VSRRSLTLLLSGVLALGLLLSASVARVPYVALLPGPVYDTLGAEKGTPTIAITGARTYGTDGRLDLLTVLVDSQLTLGSAVRGWFDRNEAVVPRDLVFGPGLTDKQVEQDNQRQMAESQDAATLAALHQLGIRSESVSVKSVPGGSPSEGRLQPGDVLRTVDDKPVLDGTSLRTLIAARQPGQPAVIGYTRGGTLATATITTTASTDQPPRPLIGVATAETPDPQAPKVTINLKEVGGPSAGMMFALGIIDKLGPDSLTGGRHIAGTGEITADGTVGPIGGIGEKLLSARRAGATLFLAPAGNCAEAARSLPAGLVVAKVATLQDALTALQTVRDGRAPVTCTG